MKYFNTLNEETKTLEGWILEIESEGYHKNVIQRYYSEEGEYVEEEVCMTPQEYMSSCIEDKIIVQID